MSAVPPHTPQRRGTSTGDPSGERMDAWKPATPWPSRSWSSNPGDRM